MSRLPINRTSQAENDLISIWSHIAQHSEKAADHVLDRVEARLQQLRDHPYSGRARDEISSGIRHLVVGPYLTFYRVGKDSIDVLRVIDGRRNITGDDFES